MYFALCIHLIFKTHFSQLLICFIGSFQSKYVKTTVTPHPKPISPIIPFCWRNSGYLEFTTLLFQRNASLYYRPVFITSDSIPRTINKRSFQFIIRNHNNSNLAIYCKILIITIYNTISPYIRSTQKSCLAPNWPHQRQFLIHPKWVFFLVPNFVSLLKFWVSPLHILTTYKRLISYLLRIPKYISKFH